jgi:alpha-beta hydrolase superfamily lysophospholipase
MIEKFSTEKLNQGNVILTHGLNLNPEKLKELASWFNGIGMDVYLLRYSGHRPNERAMEFSFETSINLLKNLVEDLKGNYIYCAFSLGCLIYAKALEQQKIVEAQRNIFLSPAFKPTKFIQISGLIPFNLSIPSLLYKDYQIHRSLPSKIYREISRESNLLRKLPFQNKTIVFLDEGDLALDVNEILKNISNYEVKYYKKRQTPAPRHIMVDSHTVGLSNWDDFLKTIHCFLEAL